MQVLSIWQLSIPLPAVMLITVSLYMVLVGVVLWIRHCRKDWCCSDATLCSPGVSLCDQCYRVAEMCDCSLPTVRSFLPQSCPSPACPQWDFACTCQPPDCDSCNCLCFEIRIK